jgi:ATP-binding cassette subfamily C (CFTR/MRP) protein 1
LHLHAFTEFIPSIWDQFVGIAFQVLGAVIFVGTITPWFFVALPPISIVYLMYVNQYTPFSRNFSRLFMTSMSPIFAVVLETMQGMTSIKAFDCKELFIRQYNDMVDRNVQVFLLSRLGQRWMDLRLDILTAIIVAVSASCIVLAGDDLSPELSGLSLSFTGQLTGMLGLLVLFFTFFEAMMASVERIMEFNVAPQEANHNDDSGAAINADGKAWPSAGKLQFDDVSFRYFDGGPLILDGVSFEVPAGASVGVVGRTGAGKSSMLQALFRMNELAGGSIKIDGVCASTVSLNRLRSAVSIVPQEPVLFSGSVRDNLDPFKVRFLVRLLLWCVYQPFVYMCV